jgi:GNAT superfamily N-acetyltransferase
MYRALLLNFQVMFEVKLSETQKELDAIIVLRHKILRQPWNQPADSATDVLDAASVNAFIKDVQGNTIACGRLQVNEYETGQIRFMAVDTAYQGKGLGRLILEFLEKKAEGLDLTRIELQARENALRFYQNNGYSVKEKSFLLWDIIQHYLMEKEISRKK